MPHNLNYYEIAPTNLGAGIQTPSRKSANRCSVDAPFLWPVVYDRLCSGSSERRSLSGSLNSAQPVTLLFQTNGGSSLNQKEATTMSNLYDIQLCHLTLAEMFALKFYLKQIIQLDKDGIKHARMNAPELISACKKAVVSLESLEAIGGVQ